MLIYYVAQKLIGPLHYLDLLLITLTENFLGLQFKNIICLPWFCLPSSRSSIVGTLIFLVTIYFNHFLSDHFSLILFSCLIICILFSLVSLLSNLLVSGTLEFSISVIFFFPSFSDLLFHYFFSSYLFVLLVLEFLFWCFRIFPNVSLMKCNSMYTNIQKGLNLKHNRIVWV